MSGRLKIAIPVGDPAGIGPEIALKAALDPGVRAACDPIVVCDGALLERHAKSCGIDSSQINVLACPQPETASLGFGLVSPISGRASIAFCAAAVKAAMAGDVAAGGGPPPPGKSPVAGAVLDVSPPAFFVPTAGIHQPR